MFTIIGADGNEYGPVSIEQLKGWIAAGRANGQTKARREGESEWKSLAEYPEFGVTLAGPPPVTTVSPGAVVEPTSAAADLVARAPQLDIFGTIGQSWELYKAHFWPLVGGTAVSLVVQGLLGVIPFLGALVGLLLGAVFMGGLNLYYLRFLRGETPQFADIFAGFTLALVPLMLGGLVSTLLTGVGFLLLVIPGIYLAVAWVFTALLIIDQKLEFWTAMEISRRVVTAQWWRMFGLMIVAGILGAFGAVVFIVGLFFTIPITIGSIVVAYETLCNPPAKTG